MIFVPLGVLDVQERPAVSPRAPSSAQVGTMAARDMTDIVWGCGARAQVKYSNMDINRPCMTWVNNTNKFG